jgi:hypothetical protein
MHENMGDLCGQEDINTGRQAEVDKGAKKIGERQEKQAGD